MRIKILIVFLFLTLQVSAQNEKQKWTAGISLASAHYMTEFQGGSAWRQICLPDTKVYYFEIYVF
jgi:hypothetical protein